jgi:hypothetical protein
VVMVVDLAPGLKRFVGKLSLGSRSGEMAARMILAFLFHAGRMSCLQAAGAVRSSSRHRAQVGRWLDRRPLRSRNMLILMQAELLRQETCRGTWVFIIDATLVSQAGRKTENTYSTGDRPRRPAKGRRYGQRKHARKRCHSFTMGLLITPSGLRIPRVRPHYTAEYCQKNGLRPLTTAQIAAEMIRDLQLPAGAEVIVLGDAAYDAAVVRQACAARGFEWIFPCNPERVLSGGKPRPKVRSLLKNFSSWKLQTVRFRAGQGAWVAYRRLSPHRVGPKAKPRTFYVHQERRNVHSVGEVRLLFSTAKPKLAKATPDDVKILLTSSTRLSVREVIELYTLRWQIELFFKELKSSLGFHQYRFRKFDAVESWVELALTAFLYLEGYRARQLARRALSDKERQWWRHQRTHGLCQAVRQATSQAELEYLHDRLATPGGIARLKRLIRHSFPSEYQAAL